MTMDDGLLAQREELSGIKGGLTSVEELLLELLASLGWTMASRLSLLVKATAPQGWTNRKVGTCLHGLRQVELVRRSAKQHHTAAYWAITEKGQRYLELGRAVGDNGQEEAAP